jgi:hypothetical protein
MAIDYSSASISLSQAGLQVPRRQFFCDEVGRREFICGGSASVLSVILAALLAGSVKALQEINPTYVVPLHYTGEPFYETARAAMPTKLLRSYTGTRLVFEA